MGKKSAQSSDDGFLSDIFNMVSDGVNQYQQTMKSFQIIVQFLEWLDKYGILILIAFISIVVAEKIWIHFKLEKVKSNLEIHTKNLSKNQEKQVQKETFHDVYNDLQQIKQTLESIIKSTKNKTIQINSIRKNTSSRQKIDQIQLKTGSDQISQRFVSNKRKNGKKMKCD